MKKFAFVLVMLVVLVPTAVLAAEAVEVPDIDLGAIEEYVAAVGIGAVLTLLVDILKRAGVVPDGQAGVWATAANLVVFAGLYIGGIFGFDVGGDATQNIIAIAAGITIFSFAGRIFNNFIAHSRTILACPSSFRLS